MKNEIVVLLEGQHSLHIEMCEDITDDEKRMIDLVILDSQCNEEFRDGVHCLNNYLNGVMEGLDKREDFTIYLDTPDGLEEITEIFWDTDIEDWNEYGELDVVEHPSKPGFIEITRKLEVT